ncbi:MAG: caspase family protein [Chloroflexota bacterium]
MGKNNQIKGQLPISDEADTHNTRAILDPDDFPEDVPGQEFAKNLALVIGIDAYQKGYPALETALNDAQTLAGILAKKHDYQIEMLLDEQATLTNLQDALDGTKRGSWASQIGPNDRVLFYFAGHGIAEESEQGPAGYLLLQDADRQKAGSGRLEMLQLHHWLQSLNCRHLLVILDSCFAGAMRWSAPGTRDIPPEVIHQERYQHYIQYPAWQLITSAGDDEKALDSVRGRTEEGHSPFAQALIEALQDGAGDIFPPGQPGQETGDGLITASELTIYLENRVSQVAAEIEHRQVPKLWPMTKHGSGEFVFLNPKRELQLKPAPKLDKDNNPYRTEALTEDDNELFYGREDELNELVDRVQQNPITVVVGASGVGKSSLVRAGLVPRLRGVTLLKGGAPSSISDYGDVSDESESENLLTHIHPETWQLLPVLDLREQTNLDIVIDELGSSDNTLLIIDHLEAILAPTLESQPPILNDIQAFLATKPEGLRVVFALRADFTSRLSTVERLAQAPRFELPPLGSEGDLRLALERPAWAKVLYFDPPEVVDTIIEEINQGPGALALLAEFGSQMYLNFIGRQSKDRARTDEDYEALGCVKDFITDRMEAIHGQLDNAEKATLHRLMLRFLDVGGGLKRRQVPRAELVYDGGVEDGRVEDILTNLTEARLLVWNSFDGEPTIELAHDSLIRDWDRIRDWRKAEQDETLLLQRRITEAAREWATPPQLKTAEATHTLTERVRRLWSWLTTSPAEGEAQRLWHNSIYLPQVEGITEGNPYENKHWLKRGARRGWDYFFPRLLLPLKPYWLNALESTFVNFSLNKRRRGHRLAALLIVNIFLMLAIATGYALLQQSIAEERRIDAVSAEATAIVERDIAISRQLASQAQIQIDSQLDLSLLLSVAANRVRQTLESKSSLIITLQHEPRLKAFLYPEAVASNLAFIPDSDILIASVDNEIRAWDINTLMAIDSFSTITHDTRIGAFAVNADGSLIATSDDTGYVRVWDVKRGAKLNELALGDTSFINSIEFSPTEELLAIATSSVMLWSYNKQTAPKKLEQGLDHVAALAFTPDGRRLATQIGWDEVVLWDVTSGKWATSPEKGHVDGIADFIFSRDGKMLISGSLDRTIMLWNGQSGEPLLEDSLLAHSMQIESMDISPNGLLLATGSSDATVVLWDLNIRQPFGEPLTDHDGWITDVAFSPDGKTLATSSADQQIILWDVTNEPVLGQRVMAHETDVQGISFSPDGQKVVTSSSLAMFDEAKQENIIKIWDAITRHMIGDPIQEHQSLVDSVDFHPKGKLFASGSWDGSARLWNINTQEQIFEAPLIESNRYIQTVLFSPDGSLLAINEDESGMNNADGMINLYDIASQEVVERSAPGFGGGALAFSPDGAILASGITTQTLLLDTKTLQLLGQPLTNATGRVRTVAFSPDGFLLATGHDNAEIHLWDVVRRQLAGNPLKYSFGGNELRINSLLFNADSSILIVASSIQWQRGVASNQPVVTLWDVPTRRVIGEPLIGHRDQGEIWAMDISPDGHIVVSGDAHGELVWWDIQPTSWEKLACKKANRNLSPDEWDEFIGSALPYQAICPKLSLTEAPLQDQ